MEPINLRLMVSCWCDFRLICFFTVVVTSGSNLNISDSNGEGKLLSHVLARRPALSLPKVRLPRPVGRKLWISGECRLCATNPTVTTGAATADSVGGTLIDQVTMT